MPAVEQIYESAAEHPTGSMDPGDRDSGHRGATSLEYALLAVLIAAVIVLAVQQLGTNACNSFSRVGSALR